MMTNHFFENDFVKMHYYKFGEGSKIMLCFHGYGMHGKQFQILEESLGKDYTFYGFDLFFHKKTKLKDQSLAAVKRGISKKELANLIKAFCDTNNILKFSVIGYSMGTHYATAITEELPDLIEGYIATAPSCLNPGIIVKFLSKYTLGNLLLEKLVLSEKALIKMLSFFRKLNIIDQVGYDILFKEIGTAELRFNFYACFTYLRFLETNQSKLLNALNKLQQDPIFIFGKRDVMYPPRIGKTFLNKLRRAKVIILDENHEMINSNFVKELTAALL